MASSSLRSSMSVDMTENAVRQDSDSFDELNCCLFPKNASRLRTYPRCSVSHQARAKRHQQVGVAQEDFADAWGVYHIVKKVEGPLGAAAQTGEVALQWRERAVGGGVDFKKLGEFWMPGELLQDDVGVLLNVLVADEAEEEEVEAVVHEVLGLDGLRLGVEMLEEVEEELDGVLALEHGDVDEGAPGDHAAVA